MKTWVARLIAYVFLGSFCIAGPLLLVLALGTAVQRVSLIYSGLRAQGTVIAKRTTGSTRATYAPVFQFKASDGRTVTVNSDVYGEESAFSYGQRVQVLYRRDNPDSARLDKFGQLWTLPLVVGVVGAGFSIVPAIMLVAWMRRRAAAGGPGFMKLTQAGADNVSRLFRGALGVMLIGGGAFLLAVGLGFALPDASSVKDSRVLVTSTGVLLSASGVLVAQWVAMESRLAHALGGAVITSMAVIFGWVAIFGEASGFSGGISIGGAAVSSSGSVTPARIAFGLGSVVFGLASMWAWRQVFRQRGTSTQ